jgi:hypothetical protein
MKKFFFILILLAAAGYVFISGWVQMKVPVGSYGVLRSKTHGTDPAVVKGGEFRWVWYGIIPTNMTVLSFTLPELSSQISLSGSLPSGQAYAAMAGLKTDFSWEIDGSVSAVIKAENLPAIVESKNITGQNGLDAYAKTLAGELESAFKQKLLGYAEQEDAMNQIRTSGTISRLESDLASSFPDLTSIKCGLETVQFPNFTLYKEVYSLYESYLSTQKKSIEEGLETLSAENLERIRRVSELTQYGELLSKYPVLLDYLALEKGIAPPQLKTGQ